MNFPNNPTGAVCSPAEMRQICDVLLKHKHVLVMADDVYEHLVYGDATFSTVAEVEPALKDRTLTVNGASKAYAMTGWRVGFAGGPRAMIAAMTNMQGQIGSGISTISQAAAVAALDGPQELLKERAADYQKRRDEVVAMLRAAKGVTCHLPEGAFYVFPNIAGCIGKTSKGGRTIANDTDFVTALLEEKHVATVQGAAYGMSPTSAFPTPPTWRASARAAAAFRSSAPSCARVFPSSLESHHQTHAEKARRAVSKHGHEHHVCCPSFETRRFAALLRMRRVFDLSVSERL